MPSITALTMKGGGNRTRDSSPLPGALLGRGRSDIIVLKILPPEGSCNALDNDVGKTEPLDEVTCGVGFFEIAVCPALGVREDRALERVTVLVMMIGEAPEGVTVTNMTVLFAAKRLLLVEVMVLLVGSLGRREDNV
jgi:hypothetical protein